jgi:hypothetical protein
MSATQETYRWSDIYDRGVDLFHEPPTGQMETDLINAFRKHPARFVAEMERLGSQILAGADIRSGWGILRKRMQDQPDDITATDSGQLEKKILNARRWIHNAGLYLDRESDVLDELFPEHGSGFDSSGGLRAFDTPSLRAEMIEAWKQERPRDQRAEKASADYMAKLRDDTRRLETMRREAREAAMEGQEA